jgi:hypothetical protein
MGILVVFLGILGFYFIAVKYLNISSEKCLFVLASALILLLYWFTYFNLLLPGAWLILLLGLFALVILPFILYQDKEIIFTKYITPVFVFTLIYIVILSLASIGLHLYDGDEFSHWGPHAKYMFLRHGFIRAQDTAGHRSYPPGGSLFYYLSYLIGNFSEAKTYIMQQLLILVTVPVVLKNIRWKDWPLAFLGYSLMLLIFKAYNVKMGYEGSLYMDLLSGIYFGSIIISYRLSDRKCTDILWLIPPVFALSIFKLKLFPLVLIITAIIFLDQLWLLKSRSIKNIIRRFFSVLSIPVASLIAIISWNHYIKNARIAMEWGLHPTKIQLLNLFTGRNLSPIKLTTIANYKHMLLTTPLLLVVIFTLLTGLTFVLLKEKKEKYTVVLDYVVMLFGFLGYAFGLFLMYLYSFDSYSGSRLASANRYFSIYHIAWSIIIFARLFRALQSYKFIKKRIIQFLVIGLIVLSMMAIIVDHYHRANKPGAKMRSSWLFRQAIQRITNKVKQRTGLRDQIFIVWQSDSVYQASVVMYELIPRFSATNVWMSLSCWSPKQFTQTLKNYDYLLLGYTDKKFWDMFGGIFPAKPPRLKPLINYTIYIGKEFNSIYKPGYKLKTEQAYLFEIQHKNGSIRLINIR